MTRRRVELEYTATGSQALESRFRSLGDSGERAMRRLRGAVQQVNPALVVVNASAMEAQAVMEDLSTRIGPLGSLLRALGPAGLAAGAALGGATLALATLAQAGQDAERGQLRLQAMLRATGRVSGHTAAEIDAMAIELARTTNATAGAAGDVTTALLAYTAVTGENFRRVLQLSQDLAEAGFGSLSRNADRLARSLEEPEKAFSRLTRMGVVLNQTQREQIELMVEAGNKAGAQAVILAELERRVGGTGAAAAEGLTGAWGSLNTNIQLFINRMAEAHRITERMATLIGRIAGPMGQMADAMTPQGGLLAVNARIAALQDQLAPADDSQTAARQGLARANDALLRGGQWMLDRFNPWGGDPTPLWERTTSKELERLLEERRALMAELDQEYRAQDRAALRGIREQERRAIAALNSELAETLEATEARVLELSLSPADKIERTAQEARRAVERAIEQGADPEAGAEALAAIEARRTAELERLNSRAEETARRQAETQAARAAQQQERNQQVLAGLEREIELLGIADQRERARIEAQDRAAARLRDAGPEAVARARELAGQLFDEKQAEQDAVQVQNTIERMRGELAGLERAQGSAVAALDTWRRETLASLDETAEGYAEFAGLVEDIYRRRLPDARKQDLALARDWQSGVARGLAEIAENAGDAATQTQRVFARAFRGLEDGLTSAIMKGKADWRSFMSAIIEDVVRMQLRLAIINPLASGMQRLFEPAEATATVAHSGGIIGQGALPQRSLPVAAFLNAPRYHGGGIAGLAPDERPAVLRVGEEVLTTDNPRHRRNAGPAQNITINVSAPGGDPAQVRRSMGRAASELARVVARGQRQL